MAYVSFPPTFHSLFFWTSSVLFSVQFVKTQTCYDYVYCYRATLFETRSQEVIPTKCKAFRATVPTQQAQTDKSMTVTVLQSPILETARQKTHKLRDDVLKIVRKYFDVTTNKIHIIILIK